VRVLAVNAGSSSLKLSLLDGDDRQLLSTNLPASSEGIDEAALRAELERAGPIDAVGHRIVHGGSEFVEPVLIDDRVLRALDVLPTDVVNAADRGLASDGAVWSSRVVVVEPVWQRGGAVVVGAVDEAVGPFPRHRLVEALDLPVCLRPVGLGCEVPDLVVRE